MTRSPLVRFVSMAVLASLAVGGSSGPASAPVSIQESAAGANTLEVRFTPGDLVIPSVAKPPGLGYQGVSAYYDLMVQAIAFVNHGDRPLSVQELWLDVMRGPTVLQRQAISIRELQRATRTGASLTRSGVVDGLDVHYNASTLLGNDVPITPGASIEPGAAALVDDCYVITRGLPTSVQVTVVAHDDEGHEVRGEGILLVRQYTLQNEYTFPLEGGHWWVVAFPGLQGHHRWTHCTEHALDITKVDERGAWAEGAADDWHQGLVPEWEDWYAYGSRVLAAADGKVVRVSRGDAFPLSEWGRREGETFPVYQRRIGALQNQRFARPDADSMAVAGGNYVVIEHAGGECSFYAHLAHDSILVNEGDEVAQGQPIAAVGGTGEAPVVHLHFQVGLGHGATARTVPLQFTNVKVNARPAQNATPPLFTEPGFFVSVDE